MTKKFKLDVEFSSEMFRDEVTFDALRKAFSNVESWKPQNKEVFNSLAAKAIGELVLKLHQQYGNAVRKEMETLH